ncbi:RNaseH domain-containing protein [Calothrix sp. CCY 0018]|uniref:RNaseH domain-containing protein n=1 Tax=Calothrix sp. CCY 0018 TaxID=3103864 RepID=UPI0039C6AD5E
MSAQYNKIRLCAFQLKHDLPEKQFYALKFPQEAKDLIKNLVAVRDNRSNNKVSIPITSLNAALRASIPGLIYIGKIWEKFWLYSPAKIPTDKLLVIFSHWLDTEFPDENPSKPKKGITYDQREAVMRVLLSPNNFKWESVTLKTELWKQFDNGTADITEDADSFILLPDILATQLSDPDLKFKLDDETIQFYRCAPSEGGGAELISFPPLPHTHNKRNYYYSIVLTLKVQTVPFQPYPQLQCDMSIRRWCSMNDTRLLLGGQASSVYIRTKVKWGEKINPYGYTEYFQIAPLVWKGEPKWDNNLASLLDKFNPLSYTPQEILANPIQSLNIQDIPNICITYKDGIIPGHKVGKGLPPKNRRQLIEQIALSLKDDWELINYERFQYKINTKKSAKIFDLPKPDGTSWTMGVPKRRKAESEEQFKTRYENLLKKQELDKNKLLQKKVSESSEKFQVKYDKLLKKQESERTSFSKKEAETDEEFEVRYENLLAQFAEKLSLEGKRLCEAIRNCIGKELTIEIWYINSSTRDALIKAVWYCLGLKTSTANTHKFPDIDLTVTIRTQAIGKLAERLPLSTDNKKKPTSGPREKAINIRMDEIAEIVNKMPPVTGRVGVLVELYGENHWKPEWTDPQAAIRLGFAQEKIDRVSKFIVPEHEEVKNKYEKLAKEKGRELNNRERNEIKELQEELPQKAITSFLDLLRSLGVQIAPPRIVIPSATLPDSINYVGLWLVDRTSKTSAHGKQQLIPIMVKMRSDSQIIEATFNGLSNWIPYDEALRKINTEGISITGDNNELKREIKGFLKRMLQSKELRGKDTLLLCDAQNIRRYWTWLQDKQISQEGVVFGTESPQLMPKLSVVRVRQDGETPEWYALHNTKKQKVKLFDNLVELEQISVATEGLFYLDNNERIFLSIGEKSNTMPKEKLDFSKFDKPQLHWSNPAILELTVACIQPGDKPEHWAILTHELRRMALQYKDTLARPIVLHLAAQMADYVLMVSEEDERIILTS